MSHHLSHLSHPSRCSHPPWQQPERPWYSSSCHHPSPSRLRTNHQNLSKQGGNLDPVLERAGRQATRGFSATAGQLRSPYS
eukprot:scaffold192135_cov23-Tisochrysis_lutea.AAC.2